MEKIEWTNELKLGIDVLDGQHKKFIKMCAEIEDCAKSPKKCEKAVATMEKLKKLAIEHFITESGLYNKTMYPDKAGHDRLHAHFLEELLGLEKRSQRGEAGEKFAVEIREKLTDWFVLHIEKNDIQMASYILKK